MSRKLASGSSLSFLSSVSLQQVVWGVLQGVVTFSGSFSHTAGQGRILVWDRGSYSDP